MAKAAAKTPKRSREELLRIAQIDERILPELPEPPEGFVYRWARVSLGGKDDVNNISKYIRGGWQFVKPDEIELALPIRDYGKYEGYVGVGDMALAILPADIAEARTELVQQKTQDLMAAVNHQLGKLQDSRMPIHNESKSTVRRGKEARFE